MLFSFFKKNKEEVVQSSNYTDWNKDRFQSLILQRNFLIIAVAISAIIIFFSLFTIRFLNETKSIEPFVIEVEKKTGIPTVVNPMTSMEYTANEAIVRYFVMKYIKSREEYFNDTFNMNYYNVVRVLSTSNVYYGDYRPNASPSNPTSPKNLYGDWAYRTVALKSIIFPTKNSAQVRISLNVSGQDSSKMDKIVFMEFDFLNLEMNDQDRLLNPLGFQVKLYRIEDERS